MKRILSHGGGGRKPAFRPTPATLREAHSGPVHISRILIEPLGCTLAELATGAPARAALKGGGKRPRRGVAA